MKLYLTLITVTGFALLGIDDLIHHELKIGIASVMLAAANGLLLL